MGHCQLCLSCFIINCFYITFFFSFRFVSCRDFSHGAAPVQALSVLFRFVLSWFGLVRFDFGFELFVVLVFDFLAFWFVL